MGYDTSRISGLPVWPAARLGDALQTLAEKDGRQDKAATNPPEGLNANEIGRWIDRMTESLGLESLPQRIAYPDIESQLNRIAPALLRLNDGAFLVLVGAGKLLGENHRIYKVRPAIIRDALCRDLENNVRAEVESLLADARIPERRRRRARNAMLRERLRDTAIETCWLVRRPPGMDLWQTVRESGLLKKLFALFAAHTTEYVLWILAWWMVGLGAIQGHLDRGWLIAWALILLTLIPFRMVVTWLQGSLSLTGGGLLKEQLLRGALRLEPEEIRHQGAGHLLGRVLESETLETLALSGGFLAVVAVIELIIAGTVLALGSGGPLHAVSLIAWAAGLALTAASYYRRAWQWAQMRLRMTHDVTELMVGHRTRLGQQSPEHWHDGEDQTLTRYLQLSTDMDRRTVWLTAAIPRGWLIVGILALCPAFVSGTGTAEALAVGLGGVLLAYRAFRRLGDGVWSLAGAAICWKQVAPLFHAGERTPACGNAAMALQAPAASKQTLIELHDVAFRYDNRPDPVLQGCSLRILAGDRIILEGPSGGGKSTLASLVTGLRKPTSGLLLVRGMDMHALGASGWRRVVAAAPQFHENHVITGSLAFNLLMSRDGIPEPADLDEAEAVCADLGLKGLIDRMPSGIMQMVGESGWQLSHGERSRLYIARALLQHAEVIVLDESFAALDPENFRLTLDCVLKRAPTLIVIAHR